ncbi:biotin--[acetyl-CoA-carboxylase] ligase [Ruthenibacterium lactatiformans]|uniref:biotin--[acetyl-CoA-carboxylase] ligase n=1 Tax=Ruthenibacterium lactatiformans TaxID=1550024 RepID=UPI0035212152
MILAGQQTGGRGRSGRSFQSPPSKGLYLTALLRPTAAPAAVLPVTALAAVAACRAIERICGLRPGIKWTNDLVLDTRKLVGILTEMGVEGETGVLQYVAVGIGINLNQTQADFSGAVADMATSLRMVLGRTVSRAELAVALMEELDRLYAALLTQDYAPWLAEYRRSCVYAGPSGAHPRQRPGTRGLCRGNRRRLRIGRALRRRPGGKPSAAEKFPCAVCMDTYKMQQPLYFTGK